MNIVEWGVRRAEGGVVTMDPAAANEAYMTPEEMARNYVQIAGTGAVVSRTRTSSTTAWSDEDADWVPGCQEVLAEVFAERQRQVATYGLNDECADGTGPDVLWLFDTHYALDLRNATEIEAAFRHEYERYEQEHGVVTWRHLIREEVAEAFMEVPGTKTLEAELLQIAALCVSWVEAIRRRG